VNKPLSIHVNLSAPVGTIETYRALKNQWGVFRKVADYAERLGYTPSELVELTPNQIEALGKQTSSYFKWDKSLGEFETIEFLGEPRLTMKGARDYRKELVKQKIV